MGGGRGSSPNIEEEMKTLTLDEWKAQQKKEGPKFNLRKAGEGSDIDPKWRKRLCTSREQTDKRSWTSTLLSPRTITVVEAEAVEVEAVEIAGTVEIAVIVETAGTVETVASSVSAARGLKEKVANANVVHQGKREMLLPAVEGIVEAVAVVETAVVEEEEEAASRNLTWTKRLSLPWDRSSRSKKPKMCEHGVDENMPCTVLTTYI